MVFDLGKLPQERTLQDALRGALQGIETGFADCSLKGIDEATPQDVDLLAKLKQTDTFHRRKMSGFRESLATGVVAAAVVGSGRPVGTTSGTTEAASSSVSVPSTKKELLRSAVESMDRMTAVVETGSKDLTQAVLYQNAVYEKDMQGKEPLRKGQLQSLKAADAQRSLDMLVVLKNEGVISEEEFKKRAKVLAHLQ
ncbi:hypothetical protein BWQ96_06079 [Gracilariopsis chorda]|uniref:SHOCT domain-containing protein n=1 Tax=Gracilariopsis chorda TaxID=448386 RepID=A0A2V3IST6_9FLOR|nr:hypothetical protein BWQ96_06079 [Gracilariopsis chorda]|eukprot:PXF44170.1 hypothetical protein BWQ96_06079 [Gracilariopsis chorda]